MTVSANTSKKAAANPVAAVAIPPTRPPGREYTRIPRATSPPARTAPDTIRGTGPKYPLLAASTSSMTTPANVTTAPANAIALLANPSRIHNGSGWGGAG
ncbi:Uncharacterised protein [Mycobacteroides abscessus subsp. abscessus]|nr:Uncharacterised protein [Mycobacteroides abscessus subsp. abscessus]